MKKIILLFLITSPLYNSSNNEKSKNSQREANLKGKVSFLEESVYDAVVKFGEVQKGDFFYKSSFK